MIIPAILERNWEEIEKKIELCRSFAKTLHIDFIDGKFSPNTSFMDPAPFKKYSEYFSLEAHLMTDNPTQYLSQLFEAGFRRFVGHVERMNDQVEFVAKAETLGAVGLGLDLKTPISEIKVPFEDLDQVLLMGVPAGASGQTFDLSCLEKIKALRQSYLGTIEVDGGINETTLPKAQNAGANEFCVTSFLFGSENPEEKFRQLEKLDF